MIPILFIQIRVMHKVLPYYMCKLQKGDSLDSLICINGVARVLTRIIKPWLVSPPPHP